MKMTSCYNFALIIGLGITTNTSVAMTTGQQQQILLLHNILRKQHAAPAMFWDHTLASYAANHAARCEFKHSRGRFGENLAAGFPTPTAAIQAWYGEKQAYSFQFPRYSSGTGHFTQMIWKASNKLGCATARCNGKNGTPGEYLVCEYSPAGNVLSVEYFQQNVVPPNA